MRIPIHLLQENIVQPITISFLSLPFFKVLNKTDLTYCEGLMIYHDILEGVWRSIERGKRRESKLLEFLY